MQNFLFQSLTFSILNEWMKKSTREKKANVLMDGKSVTKEKQRNCHTRATTTTTMATQWYFFHYLSEWEAKINGKIINWRNWINVKICKQLMALVVVDVSLPYMHIAKYMLCGCARERERGSRLTRCSAYKKNTNTYVLCCKLRKRWKRNIFNSFKKKKKIRNKIIHWVPWEIDSWVVRERERDDGGGQWCVDEEKGERKKK